MPRKTTGWLRKEEGCWRLDYTHEGKRKRVSFGKISKREAEAQRDKLLRPFSALTQAQREREAVAQIKSAETLEREADAFINRIPLDGMWERHPYDHTSPRRATRRTLAPRNVEENRGAWNKFVGWVQANHSQVRYVEDVTAEMAREYSRRLIEVEGLTGGRHNKLITTARVMFRLAGRPDPFADVPRYEVRHESRINLERDEITKVFAAATGELRRLFTIALYTGMRLGDCVQLEWRNIRQGRIIRLTGKTRKEVAFPVHPALAAALEEVPAAERGTYVCPDLAGRYLRNHTRLSQIVTRHLEKCGLTTTEAGDNRSKSISRRGFHSFRHTFITECARAGVPIGMIREWVGHASTEITRIYEHWAPNAGHERILSALPMIASASPAALPEHTEPEATAEELQRLLDRIPPDKRQEAIRRLAELCD